MLDKIKKFLKSHWIWWFVAMILLIFLYINQKKEDKTTRTLINRIKADEVKQQNSQDTNDYNFGLINL